MVFGRSASTPWTFGPWTSDARFLYYRVRDRKVQHLIFCDGSFVQFQGKPLFSNSGPLQWLDWTNRRGAPRLACSDESLANSFISDSLGSIGLT
jgi:hypothetical protein